MHIILVHDPPVLQFRVFLINMPPKDLQDFEVIFLVAGRVLSALNADKEGALVVKEHD